MARRLFLLGGLLALVGCEKVPFSNVQAGFELADATWFEQEQTLFVFYRVGAEQGLRDDSQVELTYRTDDVAQDWVDLARLPTVHTHLAVDCGPKVRCGSTSIHVAKPPRQVGVQLRYQRASALTLPAKVTLNVVGTGPAYRHRSLLLYGVFDGTNTRVQWRARHQFPDLRNPEVEALGLRRTFRVESPSYGDIPSATSAANPYGYAFGVSCPASLTALSWGNVQTQDRAVFADGSLPLQASAQALVCARSTVTDATGEFSAPVLAMKNPEVRPAISQLRSPIRDATKVGFVLHPCNREVSNPALAMQRQRLLLDASAVEVCLDDWQSPGFASSLASTLKAKVDSARTAGNDIVLAIVLHHDDRTGQLEATVEAALEQVLPTERDKSSPHVAGAFVFDSFGHSLATADLRNLVLWCPAFGLPADLSNVSDTAQRSCPLQPDLPDLKLGPIKINALAILPSNEQYVNFIQKYSDAEAGQMQAVRFLAPQRTPLSRNVLHGEFGVDTFFNDETLSAAPTDVFSYCSEAGSLSSGVVFQTSPGGDILPLSALPDAHAQMPQMSYALGLGWDFPFLSRLTYKSTLASSVTALSFTVPFGISNSQQAYYGNSLWETGSFPLAEALLQCTRFCGAPTFDSAGVYNVLTPFSPGYLDQCYRPKFPAPGEGGFPLDP